MKKSVLSLNNKREKNQRFFQSAFFSKNRKGLSAVVTTLIIILLVIVAVGIVWVVIKGVIDRSVEGISLDSINSGLEVERVVIDGGVKVTIYRSKGDVEIAGFNIVISDGENSQVYEQTGQLNALERRTFILDFDGTVKTVSVAPIFTKDDGQKKLGEVVDTFEFKTQCSEDSDCGTTGYNVVCDGNDRVNKSTVYSCLSGSCDSTTTTIGTIESCSGATPVCTPSACVETIPVCGNGVLEGSEACDDGDTSSGDGCSSSCTIESGYSCSGEPSTCSATCGNGAVDSGEECDGTDLNGGTCASVVGSGYTGTLSCSASCTYVTTGCVEGADATIFVSSTTGDGNWGGLTGADAECQSLATAAGFDGTWKAWLSSSSTNAADRLTHSFSAYVLPDGTTVANDWNDLTDGDLDAPINVDENENIVAVSTVHTGSNSAGFSLMQGDRGRACNDWTVAANWAFGGKTDQYQNYLWTAKQDTPCVSASCGGAYCNTAIYRLYCLKQ